MAFDTSTIFNGIIEIVKTVLTWLKTLVMSFSPQGWFDIVLLVIAVLLSWALVKWRNFAGTIAISIIGGLIYLILKLA